METRARFIVDADHCQRAADELYGILRTQQLGFTQRWNTARTTRVVSGVARWVGLIGSLSGLALVGALLYFDTQEWAVQPSAWYLPMFAAFFVFFVFTPRVVVGLQRWSFGFADKRVRRVADRCVREARRLAPYEAEFDFRGDLLIYLRGKDGVWNLAWSRMVSKFRERGLAIQGESVTVLLKRPTSLGAAIVILHRDRDWTASILEHAGITVSRLPIQRNS
jgi:hypothetical protein